MKEKIKTIGVITTGGDAPGMNAAIRAVVRTGLHHGLKVYGIERGWAGLLDGEIRVLKHHSVSGIINKGGTILHTHRCPEFRQKAVRRKAYNNLVNFGIEGLVVIGGDGSLRAATALNREFGLATINIPASIDNDIFGTDYSIGFDTAVNTAVEAIDKIRDTATSHERIFVVEVMGRNNGQIALDVGLVCGAEAILIPEVRFDLEKIARELKRAKDMGKSSFILVTAEGAMKGEKVAEFLRKKAGLDVRVSILGHMQRGGSPTALSRETACKLGAKAVELLIKGESGLLVGMLSDQIVATPVAKVMRNKKKIDLDAYRLASMLAG